MPHIRPTVCPSAEASPSEARQPMVSGRGLLTINGERHYLWRAVDQAGYGLDILVQRCRNMHGHPHGRTGKRWCREARDTTRCGTSLAPLLEQPCGEFPAAHPPAGATDAALQVCRARATLPCYVWPDYPALSTLLLPPPSGSRLPAVNAATLPNMAGDHWHGKGGTRR